MLAATTMAQRGLWGPPTVWGPPSILRTPGPMSNSDKFELLALDDAETAFTINRTSYILRQLCSYVSVPTADLGQNQRDRRVRRPL